MNRKYEFTGETTNYFGHTLHRIKAISSFGSVKKGDIGGWIETEENLSASGNAWVFGNAWVSDDARVFGNAWVSDDARVSGNAWVSGNAGVSDDALVCGEYDFITMGPIGSRSDITTFYHLKQGGIGVNCGCFNGTLDEFETAVHETHAGTEHEKAYMAAIRMAMRVLK